MPISAENKKRYPANWKAIRAEILERADQCCEMCGVPNRWHRNRRTGEITDCAWTVENWTLIDGDLVTKIVLTIAHLDHTPENCDPSNLRALCQRCHLTYDAKHHADTRWNKKRIRNETFNLELS